MQIILWESRAESNATLLVIWGFQANHMGRVGYLGLLQEEFALAAANIFHIVKWATHHLENTRKSVRPCSHGGFHTKIKDFLQIFQCGKYADFGAEKSGAGTGPYVSLWQKGYMLSRLLTIFRPLFPHFLPTTVFPRIVGDILLPSEMGMRGDLVREKRINEATTVIITTSC